MLTSTASKPWTGLLSFSTAMQVLVGFALAQQQQINSNGNGNSNQNIGTSITIEQKFTEIHPTVAHGTDLVVKRRLHELKEDVNKWEGILVPEHKEPYSNNCLPFLRKMEPGPDYTKALILEYGGNTDVCITTACSMVRTKTTDLVWVTLEKGLLRVNANVLLPDGTIVAQIRNNRFFVNSNQTFRPPERDASSLVVYDQKGAQVLELHFLAPNAVRVDGIFNDGAGQKLIITPDTLGTSEGFQPFVRDNCSVGGEGPNSSMNSFAFGGSPLSSHEKKHFLPPAAGVGKVPFKTGPRPE